ncbi:MAG TPA: hypothetical protein VNT51_07140 [Miltoncostaeaceae bacterium]|nr:hypothetical protein [Miltoncostaeaceae bacterium]
MTSCRPRASTWRSRAPSSTATPGVDEFTDLHRAPFAPVFVFGTWHIVERMEVEMELTSTETR